MKHLLTIVFLCNGFMCFGLNLDSIPQQQRDSILKHLARTTVLLYGPDYYRDSNFVIERDTIDSKSHAIRYVIDGVIKRKNDAFYTVTSLYNQSKELFEMDYSSKVFVWAQDPIPFRVNFGNGYSYRFNEHYGVQIRDLSNRIKSNAEPSEITDAGLDLQYKQTPYLTLNLSNLNNRSFLKNRDTALWKSQRVDLERQKVEGLTLENPMWRKKIQAEKKSILDKLFWQSDFIQNVFKSNVRFFSESSEYKHISYLKNSKKFKKRIVFPSFVLNENDLSNRNVETSIESIMFFTSENAAVYLADKKHVFYRINFIKIRGKWSIQNLEIIPLTLSNKLIKSGLFNKKKQHIDVTLLQNNGRLKSILIMDYDKKRTYIDPYNFFNNYQTSFPN